MLLKISFQSKHFLANVTLKFLGIYKSHLSNESKWLFSLQIWQSQSTLKKFTLDTKTKLFSTFYRGKQNNLFMILIKLS